MTRRLMFLATMLLIGACARQGAGPETGAVQTSPSRSGAAVSPAELARADSGRAAWSEADVHFVTGMIAHHAQAIVMAGWAKNHTAGPAVAGLSERIVVAQRDEIAIMQNWLRDRRLPVPEPDPRGMSMPGMEGHRMLMPGMASPEQMARLDASRGPEFDRLFLTLMIQHHQGALTMVDELLGTNGAAQEVVINRIAADVHADQSTEINRMTLMLNALPPAPNR